MKQDSKRLFSIIISLLLVVAAVVIYFDMIVPVYTSLQEIKGKKMSEEQLYTNEQQIVSEVNKVLANYQSDSSSAQSIAMALPVGQSVAGALAQIYGIAQNSGVALQNTGISIQSVQAPPTVSNSQLADAATQGSIIKPTGAVTFQISGTGTYENFKAFIQGLENNIRIFNVSAISLRPTGSINAKGQNVVGDAYNFSLTVATYYQAP